MALSLVSAFWPFLILGLASIPFFHRAVGKEEAAVIGRFGDEYREYMKRAGRFLPRAVTVENIHAARPCGELCGGTPPLGELPARAAAQGGRQ